MTKGRDNAADSLGDVLELVRMRRHSGLLSVERIQGSRFEEGEIYFQSGQPIYARTGQMLGQEALLQLLSWRQVYFKFLPDEPRPPANIPSAVIANNGTVVAANTSILPVRPPLSASGNISTTPPRFPQMDTSGLPNAGGMRDTTHGSYMANGPTTTPGLEWLIPHKLSQDRDVLSLPLTRPQRSIYLLVDGRRTVSDLARCTRKSLQEIERLLSELQERGLITV